jgi:uncharacterized protein YecT (DUF1311 family)
MVRLLTRMPSPAALLVAILTLPLAVLAQQPLAPSGKVLSPEQKAYQGKLQLWFVHHQAQQAQAKQVYKAEMARENTGDCPNAATTYDFNVCYSRQLKITDANLNAYETDIRALLAPRPSIPGQMMNPTGPSGPVPTTQQNIAEFDRVEQLWQQYRDAACTAALHQFEGGTGGPAFQMECEIRLGRNHMRELNTIYGMLLHL